MREYSETIGEKFKVLREAREFSREELAREIAAPLKYIAALEEDDFKHLPARIYAEGFLKKYLSHLELPDEDKEALLAEFKMEWDVRNPKDRREAQPVKNASARTWYSGSLRLPVIIASGTAVIFFGYVLWQLGVFLDKPELFIEAPLSGIAVESPVIGLKGRVEQEASLTVNGREITIDQYGNFDEGFELSSGLNALEFMVRDRFGKESLETRYILVK